MIPVPSGVRVWLAVGHTDMRRGMNGLPASRIDELLPWNWKPTALKDAA